MRRFTNLVFVLALISFFYYQTPAQNDAVKTQKSELERYRELKEESSYIAPLRYIIVYNDIYKLSSSERRIELLMDEKQFNEENLIKIFNLVKERFPLPIGLSIEVHTNLTTIETPEEREMADSSKGRLTNNIFLHKTAYYSRFDDGAEGFSYTTNLLPYSRKRVFLEDKSVPKPKQ
jgi:hypothetical protein